MQLFRADLACRRRRVVMLTTMTINLSRRACIVVMLMETGVMLQQQLHRSEAAWAPDDPCKDRPFKDWRLEIFCI